MDCFGSFPSPGLVGVSNLQDSSASLSHRKRKRNIHMEVEPHHKLVESMVPLEGKKEDDSNITSMEEAKTVAIGKDLGFQIDIGDPVLQEVMGKNGEMNIPK
ncbi:unnamed protein product [Lactuca saligna]|uniref:Uncharacterized protein n=1 Tax=Lactuca saligna TaxID=75948 RepID=A0AA35Y4P7_LACSI|nr:unnamed protein product [Lactuca saligna]